MTKSSLNLVTTKAIVEATDKSKLKIDVDPSTTHNAKVSSRSLGLKTLPDDDSKRDKKHGGWDMFADQDNFDAINVSTFTK